MDQQPMELRARSVGPWPMNTYALVCPHTHQSVLFDPGADLDQLIEMLQGTQPIAILLTHTHSDHIGALDEARTRLGVPVLAHPGPYAHQIIPDQVLQNGEQIEVGQHTLRAVYTPGHTTDMISYVVEAGPQIIVGDTIFDGGPGRTWSAEGFRTTLQSLRDVVLQWPDESMCYPGHGPAFRLGDRRAAIEAFVARDHGDFYGDAAWEM